jgi:inner membrane protein involved in colicin E2 resistance
MNKLINIVLSGFLWRKYKFLLVSLLLLIVFIFISGQVHQDYLAYAQSTENVSVGWSFAIKWCVWILAIALFFMANHLVNERKQKREELQEKNSALQGILAWKRKVAGNKDVAKKASDDKFSRSTADTANDVKDPFEQLRKKDKLRSYADLIIEKHKDK